MPIDASKWNFGGTKAKKKAEERSTPSSADLSIPPPEKEPFKSPSSIIDSVLEDEDDVIERGPINKIAKEKVVPIEDDTTHNGTSHTHLDTHTHTNQTPTSSSLGNQRVEPRGSTSPSSGGTTPSRVSTDAFKPVIAVSAVNDEESSLWWKGLMSFVAERRVTDIIFNAEGHSVYCRINTELNLYQNVGRDNYDRLLLFVMPPEKKNELNEKGEIDFATTTHGRRMRVNIYKALKGLAAAFRPLPNKTIPWKDNGLTEAMMKVIETTKQGLVLVTGPTGSGKSTTLCSMIEFINENFPYHIITIEDPIEYIFSNKRSVIDQREVQEHTETFQSALRASLRENPDIIFVGEIRDYETARTALMAADTGHLVFGTLHTRRVYSTISRLLEMAPESNREEMRAMLSNAIAMIICQRLLSKKGGGIYPCREVMMLNPAISALIKERKEKGISSQLTINQAKGMMEWGRALQLAVANDMITQEEAERFRDSTEDID
jgi:twitching motility protein PilT